MHCHSCGAKLKQGSKFCAVCGAKQLVPAEANHIENSTQPEREPAPKGSKPWLLIAGCAVIAGLGLLALLLGGGFLYFSQDTNGFPSKEKASYSKPTPTLMPLSATPEVLWMSTESEFKPYFKPAQSDSFDITIQSEGYFFDIKRSDTFLTSISNRQFENLAIDVILSYPGEFSQDAIAGLIVRAVESSGAEGLLFEISTQGKWRVEKKQASGERELITPWAASEAINTDGAENHLGLVVSDSTIVFIINGEELYSIADAPREGRFWGLVGATPQGSASAQILIKDVRVEEIFDTPVDERPNVLARLGRPDSFYVLFEQETDGGITRVEEWSYLDQQTLLTFMDGVLMGSETMDYFPGMAVVADGYDPFMFTDQTTLEDVRQMVGGDLSEMELISEFGADAKVYAGDQILVGFSNGVLEYVETFVIETPQEASAQ